MLEDVTTITLPVRSRLYSLAMQGAGGCDQEAILDYAQRLSLEHHVSVRDMFAQVILPEAGLGGAFFIPGHFSAHAIRGCNGWSSYAQAFLASMQRLTMRADLDLGSMAAWGHVLNTGGYVARLRRWCPACLQGQRTRGFHTFSLLWTFEPVRVCPIHMVQLNEMCSNCGRAQPIVGDLLAAGLCDHCRVPLADCDATSVNDARHGVELFRARAVAGMIDLYRHAADLVCAATYTRRLREVADTECGGSFFRLERQLRLSYGALRPQGKHTLNFFLEVMRRLGTEPAEFFDATGHAAPDAVTCAVPYRAQQRRTEPELATIGARVSERLHQARQETGRPTTRLELIRDVGISNTFLQSRFPDVVRELRRHNDSIRPGVHRALWDRRGRKIDEAMRSLIATGRPLTANLIGKALAAIGLHRLNPEVRRLASEALERARHEVESSLAPMTQTDGDTHD